MITTLFLIGTLSLAQTKEKDKEGDLIKPINLDKINSKKGDVDPHLTGDNLVLLYSSNRNKQFEIFAAKRTGANAPFPEGKVYYKEADADVRSAFFHKGYLYFATNMVPDEKFKALKNFDIYRRIEPMSPIPFPSVNEKEDDMHPWLTPLGKEVYFSRKLKSGWTLMVADGPAGGAIGKPAAVGFPPGFHHATLAANGLMMYLEGPIDEDDTVGIFKSQRARVGAAWSKPEPVKGLHHPDSVQGDMHPCLSADGTRLFFVSDRPGGKGGLDIWAVPTVQLK